MAPSPVPNSGPTSSAPWMRSETGEPHETPFDYYDFYARKRGHPDCVFSRAIIPGAHSQG